MAQGVPGRKAEQPARLWDSPWVVAGAGGAFAIGMGLTYWRVPAVGPTVRGPFVIPVVLVAEALVYSLPIFLLARTYGLWRCIGWVSAIAAGRAVVCCGVFAFGDELGLYRDYGARWGTPPDGDLAASILRGIWAEYLAIPAAQVAWIALVLSCAVYCGVRGKGLPVWPRLTVRANEVGSAAPGDLREDRIAPRGAPVARTGRRRRSVGRLMIVLLAFACLVFFVRHRMTHCCIGCAVLCDDARGVEWFVNHGADPIWGRRSPGEGETLLYTAATLDRAEPARALLERGANVNLGTPEGDTPLHRAAASGSARTARLLLEHGADVNGRVQAGATPLHCAARCGQTDVAELLLARGADVNAKDENGETALTYALKADYKTLAKLLRQHGAKE